MLLLGRIDQELDGVVCGFGVTDERILVDMSGVEDGAVEDGLLVKMKARWALVARNGSTAMSDEWCEQVVSIYGN